MGSSRGSARRSYQAGVRWALVCLLATSLALAQPAPIDLKWEAPSGCPQQSDVRDRIQKLLGARRTDSHLRAEGTIARTEGRYRLELVVRIGNLVGTRSIDANSCEDLGGAAAVALALLIHSVEEASAPGGSGTGQLLPPGVNEGPPGVHPGGPEAHPGQPTTIDSGQAKPTPQANPATAESETKPPQEQPSSPESHRAWRVLVQAPLLALSVGPLPGSARGIGVSGGVEYASWQLHLRAFSWQGQSVPAADYPGYGADIARTSAALWACRAFRTSRFGVAPCITVGLENVSVSGTGPNIVPSDRQTTGIAVGAGLQGRLYLASWIRVLTVIGGQLDLSRPQISLDGVGSVYDFAPAALTVAVGSEWIF